jgi:diguanylate cyclase (GGDEF)-like protein/PAS domain S-box-containing protein
MPLYARKNKKVDQVVDPRTKNPDIKGGHLDNEPLADQIINLISEGIITVNSDGVICDANQAALSMLGVLRNDFIGTPIGSAVRTFPNCDLSPSTIPNGLLTDVEVDIETLGGKRIPVEISTRQVSEQRIHKLVIFLKDIGSRREFERRANKLALFDPLTELGNRRLFDERLGAAIRISETTRSAFALMYLDLDHFKTVNDHYGHDLGDKLLKAAARKLRNAVRESDTVIRLGGDEFAIILSDVLQSDSAEVLASRLISEFAEPFYIDNTMVKTGISIGISSFPEHARDAETLMRTADTALYDAKSLGRGRYSIYSKISRKQVVRENQLETDMKLGLARNEFEVMYQPIIRMNGAAGVGEIDGFEALARWQHPTLGILLPAKFIPAAATNGVLKYIDQHVFSVACRQLSIWNHAGLGPFKLSLNISDEQLDDPSFAQFVIDKVQQENTNPEQIQLEISEKALIQNSDMAVKIIHTLREFGVRIAIDDFGTGLSSLSRLGDLPIDAIKIDQSFVRSLGLNPRSKKVLETILGMGADLGLTTVVEGVEYASELDIVRCYGCHAVQGFVYSKPRSPSSLEGWIERNSEHVVYRDITNAA